MRTRRVLGIVGRVLIGAGLLIVLFVAYQLWGTGLAESRSQEALRQQLHAQIAHQPARPAPSPAARGTTDPSLVGDRPVAPGPAPADGQAVGEIRIPKIGVDKVVVEGTATADLHQGPGHYRGTPLPGQPGNAAIAGHRTTYGAPFYNLNELGPGDHVLVTTLQGHFRYDVTHSLVVDPNDVSVVRPTTTNQLTLTTCNPRYSASQRLVVQATLVSTPAPPSPAPGHPASRAASSSNEGLAGGQGAWLPALWWGLAVVAAGVALWLLARRRRRWWAVHALGAPAVLVLLFFFFENISPLLPASI